MPFGDVVQSPVLGCNLRGPARALPRQEVSILKPEPHIIDGSPVKPPVFPWDEQKSLPWHQTSQNPDTPVGSLGLFVERSLGVGSS